VRIKLERRIRNTLQDRENFVYYDELMTNGFFVGHEGKWVGVVASESIIEVSDTYYGVVDQLERQSFGGNVYIELIPLREND
jgi:hypothetical protein